VPVDGAVLTQQVGDIEGDLVAFTHAQHRGRQRAVDGSGTGGGPGEIDQLLADGEVEDVTREGLWPLLLQGGIEGGGGESGEGTAGGDPLDETAAGEIGSRHGIRSVLRHGTILC